MAGLLAALRMRLRALTQREQGKSRAHTVPDRHHPL